MVTDTDLPLDIRKFDFEDIAGLADFIEERFLAGARRARGAEK